MITPIICQRTQERLSDYLDERLSKENKQQIKQHLESCKICLPQYLEYKTLQVWFKESPTFEPPPDFYNEIMQEMEESESKASRRWILTLQTVAAASMIAVVVFIMQKSKLPEVPMKAINENKSSVGLKSQASFKDRKKSASDSLVPHAALRKGVAKSKREALKTQVSAIKQIQPGSPMGRLGDRQEKDRPVISTKKERQTDLVQASFRKNQKSSESLEKEKPFQMHRYGGSGFTAAPEERIELARGRRSASKPARTLVMGPPVGIETQARLEWTGEYSGVKKAKNVMIRDQETWQKIWQLHAREMDSVTTIPYIDFKVFMVTAVFAGERYMAGHKITISNITIGERVVIYYRETVPVPNLFTVQKLTYPFHIKVIPKTDLPIVFEKLH